MDAPLFLIAVLAANVVVAELLARHTPLKHLGTAMIVIITTAVCANVGWIPTVTEGSPVYDAIFNPIAYLAIFLLLLQVNLRDLKNAGGQMIALFLLGAVGTTLGVVGGMALIGGEERFGDLYRAFGGMFVGTYVGGSLNFNAIALEYGVTERPILLAGANAVDAGMTAVWMALGLVLPRMLRSVLRRVRPEVAASASTDPTGVDQDTERVHPIDLGLCLALAGVALVASEWLASRLGDLLDARVPMILILTGIALVIAHTPFAARLRGGRTLGMFGVYLFLAVIGALCDVEALRASGDIGWSTFLLVCAIFTVHGTVTFGAAALFKLDLDAASVASQANIGGGTTALAMARSLGRPDLVLPSILVGSLGTALGTFLGVLAVERLL